MKITTNVKSTVATQGVQSSSGFSIATTAHMFGILSDGLYSDKIGAVLREIGANAMDAHIMAGKPDQPFELKLPSQFDKTFHIKDFGPGLSDQDVRELYTTYGWSSKQNSNETTGAFGLGSKSPFAYTDAFSICAVKDGVKRIYTAHKDDSGKPVVSLMSETAADESWQAGVMVTFAVQPDDIDEFILKAGKIFRWFKVKPTVIGAKLELAEPAFKTRGPNFALFADESSDRYARVIMANVAYPLNVSRLEGVSELGRAVADCGAHLFVKTGTVMPTPNREDLQYDKASRPALVGALQEVAQAVAQEIYDRIKAEECSTWEWHKRIRDYAVSLPDNLKHKIKDLLALVCKNPIEAKKLENLFTENFCDVPSWAGDSRDAPYQTAQRDAQGAIIRDAAGNAVLEKMDIRGCRVWSYALFDRKASRGSNPVKRREIVRGQTRDGSNGEWKNHKLSYTDEVVIMVADVGRADLRVKYMMDEANRTDLKVLLVQPTRGADKAFVQAYAEKLAGDTAAGLGGLEVRKVSDIVLPQAIIERAKSSRLTVADRRELFREEERRYVSLTDPSCTIQEVSVGDYDDVTDRFFILAKTHGGKVRMVNHGHDMGSLNTELEKVESLAKAVANLQALAPMTGMTGFFILDPAEVSRLKLIEAGWRPAVKALSNFLKNPEWTKELAKVVDTTPVIQVQDEYTAAQAGMTGLLAHHIYKGHAFAQKVKTMMPGHTLVLVAERLIANMLAHKDGKFDVPDHQNVNKLVEKVNEVFHHTERMHVPGVARMGALDISRKTCAAYPALEMLDINQFKSTIHANADMAANLFWQFANLQVKAPNSKEEEALQKLAA
jgi:hypothetical protein